jgi:hypothetical protein
VEVETMKKLGIMAAVLLFLLSNVGIASAILITGFQISERAGSGVQWDTQIGSNKSPIGVTESLGGALLNNLGDKSVNVTLDPGESIYLYTESFENIYGPGFWLFDGIANNPFGSDQYSLLIGLDGNQPTEIAQFEFTSQVLNLSMIDPDYTFEFLGFGGDKVKSFNGDLGLVPGDSENDAVYKLTYKGTPVPEPASMLLLGSGLIGLAGFGRRKLFKNG